MKQTLTVVLITTIGITLSSREAVGSRGEVTGSESTSASGYSAPTTGKCMLQNNLFVRVSDAGEKNEVIPFRKAIRDPACKFRIENTELMEKIKLAYVEKAAHNVINGGKVLAMFDCSGKMYPDGSLAGAWVGSQGLWSWNRQECEEKNLSAWIVKMRAQQPK